MKTLLIISFSLFFINGAFCCTCSELDTRIDSSKYFNPSNEIFVGKIISHELITIKKGNRKRPPNSMNVYTIEVVTNYSLSTDKSTIKVYTSTGNCGMKYDIGKTYLILTSNPKSRKVGRVTSICRRNVLAKSAQEEIALLNNWSGKRHITQ